MSGRSRSESPYSNLQSEAKKARKYKIKKKRVKSLERIETKKKEENVVKFSKEKRKRKKFVF